MNDVRLQAALTADSRLWRDFLALCDCGGRQAGSASERTALKLVHERLARIDDRARSETVSYAGWRCHEATLALECGEALVCNALLGSAPTPAQGIATEVVDLGRGTAEDFERDARDVAGRLVLVRHEYPFSSSHVHRRRKYGWAMERGAAGFIIANSWPGAGPVCGSSGRGGRMGIPAVATDFESAARLAARGPRRARARLKVAGADYGADTKIVVLDAPGQSEAWVALSAHVDGHDLAESALDNASGVAVALAVARALAPHAAHCRRGLKVCFFSAEEWALAGSHQYLDRLSDRERNAIALNINLDTVGGDARLTALTSEFPRLEAFVQDAAAKAGRTLEIYRPLMANSDHYNFARHGIPALRLVAGFDRPDSNVRHILTRGDTRDKVTPAELKSAAALSGALLWRALTADDATMGALRTR